MTSSYRVLTAELLLLSFISTSIVPMATWADEDIVVTTPTEIVTPVEEVVIPTEPVDTSLEEDVTSDMVSGSGETRIEEPVSTESTASVDISTGATDAIHPDADPVISEISSIADTLSGTQDIVTVIPSISDESVDTYVPKTEQKPTEPTPTNEILVQFHSDIDTYVGQYQLDQIETENHLQTVDVISDDRIAVMTPETTDSTYTVMSTSFSDENKIALTDELIDILRQDPRVEHVQKNFVYHVSSVPPSEERPQYQVKALTGRSLPNDTADFANLWGLDNQGQMVDGVSGEADADIDYPEAMAYASGKLNNTVIVAILDTGIMYNHSDLRANLWDGTNCKSDTGATLGGCKYGYDFAYDDKDPSDIYGHGTHVAGTIGAVTNNGTGMAGVTPNVKIMGVKIFDNYGGTSTADIIRGISFAKYNGAKVINASFGGVEYVQTIRDYDYLTYNAIQSFPGMFVAAAGNAGSDNDMYTNFPAGFGTDMLVSGEAIIDNEIVLTGSVTIQGLANVISVAASDSQDQLAYFSNYGQSVDIAAPGVSIYSTYPTSELVSGEAGMITYASGWTRQASAHTGTWSTRTKMNVDGTAIYNPTVLWGDTRTPYVSGESAYIQKTFANPNKDIAAIKITAWCDTPDGWSFDDHFSRIDVLVSTGGLFTRKNSIDEFGLIWGAENSSTVVIDDMVGQYGKYRLYNSTIDTINESASFSLRLKWITEGQGDENLGCFVQDITIDRTQVTPSYEYLQGTSMASPHVAGAVALAWSYKPTATIDTVHDAVIWSGDYKSQFSQVNSSRRLNIANMLQALEQPTVTSQKVTLSGESTAIIDYTSEIAVVGYIGYSTNSGNLTSGATGTVNYTYDSSGYNQIKRTIITGLMPDTVYYYRILIIGDYAQAWNSDQYKIYSFRTPKVASQTITTPITTSGALYLSGSNASGIIFSGSTASGHIILRNIESTVTVDIPTERLIISAQSGTWDGIISSPVVSTGAMVVNTATGMIPVSTIYKVGSDLSSLTLSGQVATFTMNVSAPEGSQMMIYRSETRGGQYIMIATCTVTGGVCRFTTDSFSYFAIGNPVSNSSSSSVGGGGSSSPSGPGGLGGGSGVYPVIQPQDRAYALASSGSILAYSTLEKVDSIREFVRQQVSAQADLIQTVVDPIISLVEGSKLSRIDKNMMYLRVSFSMTRELRNTARDSIERSTLIDARQAILKQRKSFIQSLFAR